MLLKDGIGCTRFKVRMPDSLSFRSREFHEIPSNSEHSHSPGFLQPELGEDYDFEGGCYFRVRRDVKRLDKAQLEQRLAPEKQAALEAGLPFTKKEWAITKEALTAALMMETSPRIQITDGVLLKDDLFLGTASNGFIGDILQLLKSVDVEADFYTPWLESSGEPSEHFSGKKHWESPQGASFLRWVLDKGQYRPHNELFIEPEKGNVRYIDEQGAKLSSSGPILNLLDELDPNALILAAKFIYGDSPIKLSGPDFRISGFNPGSQKGHWSEVLATRLEALKLLWTHLDNLEFDDLKLREAKEAFSKE